MYCLKLGVELKLTLFDLFCLLAVFLLVMLGSLPLRSPWMRTYAYLMCDRPEFGRFTSPPTPPLAPNSARDAQLPDGHCARVPTVFATIYPVRNLLCLPRDGLS